MTIEQQKGEFSRRAGRVKGSPYWVREETRVANLPTDPLPEEWPELLRNYEAQRDEKDAMFVAVEKAELFERLSPEMQALFLTAEEWQDSAENTELYLQDRAMSPMSVTACIMNHDEDELSDHPK
jgi:hypothetical protein